MPPTSASWICIAPAILLASSAASLPSDKVQLTIATLHAAALTTSRAAGDSTDAPFFVVSVISRDSGSAAILPDSGRQIGLNGQLGARPLTELSLAPGDSIEVLLSVLENDKPRASGAARVATPAKTRSASPADQVDQATRLVAPLVQQGAHLLGSVSLLLTHEGGAIYWRRLDCVTSCKVLSAPSVAALSATNQQQAPGVVELSGNGGTYHLALQANRAP